MHGVETLTATAAEKQRGTGGEEHDHCKRENLGLKASALLSRSHLCCCAAFAQGGVRRARAGLREEHGELAGSSPGREVWVSSTRGAAELSSF